MCLKCMFCVTVFVFSLNEANGANILYVAPLASPSHHIWNMVLANGLVERRHNVTMLSHNKESKPLPNNFTLIELEGFYDKSESTLDLMKLLYLNPINHLRDMYNWGSLVSKHDVHTKGLETLLNYPKHYKFDIIIYDITLNQHLLPIIERFNNPPVVAVTPFLLPPSLAHTFGLYLYTSHTPFFSTTFTTDMNVIERLLNFFYTYFDIAYKNLVFLQQEEEFAKQIFGKDASPLKELERKISLLLSNIDPILDYPTSLPPNIIPVGGLHVQRAKNLPEDLAQVIDGAKNGVILFSLGSNVKSSALSLSTKVAFLKAFSKLNQIILWKYEDDDLQNVPENVILRKWLPQNDLLGHKNTVLFISHGGALSTNEAFYHGIPILGVPIFCDQSVNVKKLERKGLALELDLKQDLSSEIIFTTIEKLITDSKYRTNIQKLSKLHKSQLQTPLQRGIYWIEYILENGDLHHLNLASRDKPHYQTINLDIYVVMGLSVVLIYSFLLFIISLVRFVITLR